MNEEGPLDFPQHAVSSKELRDASVAAAKKLNAFNVGIRNISYLYTNVYIRLLLDVPVTKKYHTLI